MEDNHPNKISSRLTAAIILLAAVFFRLDLLLKSEWVSIWPARRVPVFGPWVSLELMKNPGISFSLPLGLFALYAAPIFILLLVWWSVTVWRRGRVAEFVALTLVIAGAASNWFDRFRLGYVVDYISVKNFAVFNLSDVAITLGLIFIAWRLWREESGKNQS